MTQENKKKEKRTIQVKYLARVEGEGALDVTIEGNRVTDLALRIFEPPRFFEAFLRGRKLEEAPDITSRICGICPVAYQTSAVNAMESGSKNLLHPTQKALRRLLYCGEWIESHALHIYLLHAPDFLGHEGAIEMAKKHPEIVQRGLSLKKVGNALIQLVGGRDIHPINVRVGGFYRLPRQEELVSFLPELEKARIDAEKTVRWVSTFSFPEYERDYDFVSLKTRNGEYPIEDGNIVTSTGLTFSAESFDDYIQEFQVPHSTSLHAKLQGKSYFVGPLARINLNFESLGESSKALARELGFTPTIKNPFKSIIARAIEVHYAVEESIRLIKSYANGENVVESLTSVAPHDKAETSPKTRFTLTTDPFIGYGVSEAPRGILYHRYEVDASGVIQDARICPPTSQNLMTIEEDLKSFIESHTKLPKKELGWRCEQLIRNYDPCISCSAHFLKVKWNEKDRDKNLCAE